MRMHGKKEFVFGDLVHISSGTKHFIIPHESDLPDGNDSIHEIAHIYWSGEVDAETVGEYTGRKDKNGKEIYEGDIIKDESELIFKIVFFRGCFCFKDHDQHYIITTPEDLEIIGNIHENPELL